MADIITPERDHRVGRPGVSYALGAQVLNRPLLMHSDMAGWLQQAIQAKAFDSPWAMNGAQMSKFVGTADKRSGFRVTDDGIAIMSVAGMLLDRGAWLGDLYGLATTYEGIAEQCDRLMKDSVVSDVIVDLDTGGGMAAGIWDLAPTFDALRKQKRVYSIAQNTALSGGYAIGCMAHEFYATRNGDVGSIGVIMMHMSYARALEAAGMDPTLITRGERKSDGNPYHALSHGARSELADGVDQSYEDFVRHVAKHRPMNEDEVRATEARCYAGQRGVDAKLVDGVKSFNELLAHVRAQRTTAGGSSGSRGTSKPKGKPMTEKNVSADVPNSDDASPAQQGTFVTVPSIQPQAATQTAAANADLNAEKTRIKSITTSADGQKMPALAAALAFDTALSVEVAATLLSAAAADIASGAPVEQDAAQTTQHALGNALEQQMVDPRNSARIRPEASADKTPAETVSLADRIKARAEKAAKRRH